MAISTIEKNVKAGRKLLKIFGLLLVCVWRISAAAESTPAGELEKLFEAGRYPDFLSAAKQLAEQGNADAQFLLGKAYHLGKGVDANPELARHYYGLAAKQDSARAEHNLGAMDLYQDNQPELALNHFSRALALGLKIPTFYNLGRAHKVLCDRYSSAKSCKSAGDGFSQAWEIEHKNDALDDAVVAYVTACLIKRRLAGLVNDEPSEVAAYCELATEWANKGAALGLARATYNRGAIELDAGRYTEALPWFHLAYERGLGLAAYMLGEMQEKGQGQPKDPAAAVDWFKRGAELKNEQAIERMRTHWLNEISYSFDAERIKAILAEWNKLEPPTDPPSEASHRLQLIETLAANRQHYPAFAKAPFPAHFCPEQNSLYENTKWRIFAVAAPEQTIDPADSLLLLAHGVIDAEGCLTLSATARSKLRQALAAGVTPMINWPGQRRLLSVAPGPDGGLTLETGLEVGY